MKLRLTALSENGVGTINMGSLLAEWGLSILIGTDSATILFDTGKSISVANKSDILGIDLGKIDTIVLSHAQDPEGNWLEFIEEFEV